ETAFERVGDLHLRLDPRGAQRPRSVPGDALEIVRRERDDDRRTAPLTGAEPDRARGVGKARRGERIIEAREIEIARLEARQTCEVREPEVAGSGVHRRQL